MKYIIHTYPKRLWYVTKYLIPSMIKQGIKSDDIIISNDVDKKGNLQMFLESMRWIKDNLEDNQGTWHLQDDVIICHDFKKRTEENVVSDGIVCGFVSGKYNKVNKEYIGQTPLIRAWCSFPCIYIPNKYAKEFLDWIEVAKNKENEYDYKKRYESNRHDDFFFIHFLREIHPEVFAYHVKPCLVDHIDYLIGGSINAPRPEPVRAYYWEDEDLVKELEVNLTYDEYE